MTEEKYLAKIQQLEADLALLDEGQVERVIWFMTEEIPGNTRLARRLRDALALARSRGVEVWLVPWLD